MSEKRSDATRRERERKAARIREGHCARCGKVRDGGSAVLCNGCLLHERERMRARKGSKPWRPGGPGRPPKVIL